MLCNREWFSFPVTHLSGIVTKSGKLIMSRSISIMTLGHFDSHLQEENKGISSQEGKPDAVEPSLLLCVGSTDHVVDVIKHQTQPLNVALHSYESEHINSISYSSCFVDFHWVLPTEVVVGNEKQGRSFWLCLCDGSRQRSETDPLRWALGDPEGMPCAGFLLVCFPSSPGPELIAKLCLSNRTGISLRCRLESHRPHFCMSHLLSLCPPAGACKVFQLLHLCN